MITTATPNLGAMPQQCLFPRRLRLIPTWETYPTVLSFVFDYVNRTYPLSEHLRFFAHLFNLAS